MTIELFNVNGATAKKGLLQNKIYTIISASEVKGFYDAIDSKGNPFSILDVNGDWSKIGISSKKRRFAPYSYTREFKINK